MHGDRDKSRVAFYYHTCREIRQALRCFPKEDTPGMPANAGMRCINCGKKDGKDRKTRADAGFHPEDSFLNHAMAMELLALGRRQKARSVLETLLQRDPAYIRAITSWRKLLERLGERDAALGWYEKVGDCAAGGRQACDE